MNDWQKEITRIIWRLSDYRPGENEHIDAVVADSVDLITQTTERIVPPAIPQTEGNKTLPYINRSYIDGETNGHNKCRTQMLEAINKNKGENI